MPTIKQIFLWLNTYGGAFSAISVLIAVITFGIAQYRQRKRHIDNQLGLLKSLVCELDYLGGEKKMQIGFLMRHSSLHDYEGIFSKKEIPTFEMKDIDVNRYIAGLDEKIEGESTRHLKEVLLFIHENVAMINRWTDRFLRLAHQSRDSKEVKIKEADKMYIFVKTPIEYLKILIPDAVREINTKWLNETQK